MANTYTRLGAYPIVPEAELTNLASAANKPGDNRVGGDSGGKYKGKKVLVQLTSDGTLKEAYAVDKLSSSAWNIVDGSASIVPVNILSAGGGIAWTVSAGCTYTAGLLTADGVDDPTASQTVTLKAGKYVIQGTAAYEGTTSDYDAPRLRVSGATDGALITKVFTGARHATAAEDASPKEVINEAFTLTADQVVTFKVDNVNEAGALEAGSSFIKLDVIESR